MKKRILSLAVALCLCLTFLPCVSASAAYGRYDEIVTWLEDGMTFQEQKSYFENGLAPVSQNGKSGYIDTTGKVVIPLIYTWADNFSEGRAAVRKDDKWGVIDTAGNVIVPFEYGYIYEYSEGMAVVCNGNGDKAQYGLVDIDGNVILAPSKANGFIYPFSEGLAHARKPHRQDYIDKSGNVVISLPGDQGAWDFHEGLAWVSKDDKYGYIDKTGKLVIPYMDYDKVNDFRCGRALVEKNGLLGVIDQNGVEIVPPKYPYLFGYVEDVAFFQEGFNEADLGGFIDKDGNEVVPAYYNDIWYCHEGLIPVKKNGTWGYVDRTGKEVIPPSSTDWTSAASFFCDYTVIKRNGNYGLIDKTGDEVVAAVHDFYLLDAHGSIMRVYSYDAQGFFDMQKLGESRRTAVPSPAETKVDGGLVPFAAYSLQDTTYIKLRDVAAALSGSGAQFDVGWDGTTSTITLTTGKAYTIVGGELSNQTLEAQIARRNTATVLLDGKEVSLEAFTIGGNNYFKLRDLGRALGFNVSWDSAAGSIVINTNEPYDDN